MNIVIDGILIAVAIFCVIYYSVKGFVASVVGLIRFWLALGLSVAFSGPLAEKLQPVVVSRLNFSENDSFFSQIVERVVTAGYLSRVLAFALIFVAALLAVKILELALKLLTKLPVLKFLNKSLGAVVGIGMALFWVQLLTVIFMATAEFLAGSVSWLTPEVFDNTVIAKFIYDNNLFRYMFEGLTAP